MISVIDLRAMAWPESAIDAAAQFYNAGAPKVRTFCAETAKAARVFAHHPSPPPKFDAITLVLPPADHTHNGWRLAAIQQLARECAPMRVNAVVAGIDGDAGPVLDYLAAAPGVTGQVLQTDGNSAAIA